MKYLFLKIDGQNEREIIGEPDLTLMQKYYEEKGKSLFKNNHKCSLDYIWDLLVSTRFSIYAKQMDAKIRRFNRDYINKCIIENQPIHIVLAGFPGKCANGSKVINRMPDLGELSVLFQLSLMNQLVKRAHEPGLKFTFMSDYIGLEYAFFPDMNECFSYVERIRKWIYLLDIPVEIEYITKLLPELEVFKMDFLKYCRDEVSMEEKKRYQNKLSKSIADNINIHRGREFYTNALGRPIDDNTVIYFAEQFYKRFWEFFSSKNAVSRYFGDVLYASPVAYHPEKRLCLRLQPKRARVAAWNGVGVFDAGEVYSLDYRFCKENNYMPIMDKHGHFWGFLKKD